MRAAILISVVCISLLVVPLSYAQHGGGHMGGGFSGRGLSGHSSGGPGSSHSSSRSVSGPHHIIPQTHSQPSAGSEAVRLVARLSEHVRLRRRSRGLHFFSIDVSAMPFVRVPVSASVSEHRCFAIPRLDSEDAFPYLG